MSLNILFVCSANKDRSPTAEIYFSQKYPEYNFRSAGTNRKICFQLGTDFITSEDLYWADKVVVMESKHKKMITTTFSKACSDKIVVLNIPDHFTFNQHELITILDQKVNLNGK